MVSLCIWLYPEASCNIQTLKFSQSFQLPIAPTTTASSITSTLPNTSSISGSNSLFWSNADLQKAPVSSTSKLVWNDGGNKDTRGGGSSAIDAVVKQQQHQQLQQKHSATTSKDDTFDEEGIANGIREIEMRFENELDEQEKLWPPRPDSESLTQEF